MYTGQKVRLREYRKEDIELALKYFNDPEVKRFLLPGIPYPLTLHEEQKWFEAISAFKDSYDFALETLDKGHFIGGCSISNVQWKNSVATIGISIGDKEYWGNGYGTDALKVLLSFIFNEMNINKVNLTVYSFNERAIKSYEKCGFKVEGILRQEIFKDGKYYDKVAMGILREEFKSI